MYRTNTITYVNIGLNHGYHHNIQPLRYNNQFLARIILIIYYMCLYVFVYDYLSLCVFDLGLVDFWPRRVF